MPTTLKPEIAIFSDRAALAQDAARRFVELARKSIQAHDRFCVALSGGSTPRDLYALLATPGFASQVDWSHVHVFWGDERAVPPDHADSNYRMASEALLSKVSIPTSNVHRIHAELPPNDAARQYENELREFFKLDADTHGRTQNVVMLSPEGVKHLATQSSETLHVAQGDPPRFDLILLGLGVNGHTASLFPHTRVLRETQHWVAAEHIDEVKMYRITFTAPVINAAANIMWLIAGADKADTVRQVLYGDYRPADLPAQLIQPRNSKVVWLLDAAAATHSK